MKLARIEVALHRVPVEVPLIREPRLVPVLVVRAEAESGQVGYGVAGTQQAGAVVELINRELAPAVVGCDVLAAECVWHAIEQRFNSRNMTGVVSCAVSGVDIALWDLRGKALGQPVWRLLGGYSPDVSAYVTFGLPEYDDDQLAEGARLAVERGFRRLKMVVGRGADLAHDVQRVRRVRDAVGSAVRVMIDANENLSLLEATELARAVEPLQIDWFEEPVHGNDVALLAELRRRIPIPIAAGQFEGHRFRHRDLMLGGAVDVVQTNVLFVGGYTEGLKVAHFADMLRLPVANAGGWPDHNAHLMAAVANNHGIEMHAWQWTLAPTLYQNAPRSTDGVLTLGETPGLGLDPRDDVLRDTRVAYVTRP